MTSATRRPPAPALTRRVQAVLHRRPALRLTGLLTPALVWLGLFYIVPLALLLATAFFDTDSFTGRITYEFSTDNVVDVLTTPAYLLTARPHGGRRGRGDAAVRRCSRCRWRPTWRSWHGRARGRCWWRWC